MTVVAIVILVMSMMVCSVAAAEWVEVTRFSGSQTGQRITDYFTCDHVDWRVRWEYASQDASFVVNIYQQNQIVDSITEGVKLDAMLFWHPIIESFESDPEDFYLRISVDGNVSSLAEVPVHNVTLNLVFEVRYPATSGLLTTTHRFNRNETLNIGVLVANETEQISETFVYKVDFRTLLAGSDFSYDIEWDRDDDASGVSYVQDQEGTFYMEIITDAESYTIIVEQDADSIPEFTPLALVVVLIAVSLLVVVLSKKFAKARMNGGHE